MNKLQHLKKAKDLLKKINMHRRDLLRMNYGRNSTAEMVKTMTEIDYYLGTINNFDRMMNYIGQKGVRHRIYQIIPSNKTCWKEDYDNLVHIGMVLQGKIVRAKQLEMDI